MNDWLESKEFYELMLSYRKAPATDQTSVILAFEAVKTAILLNAGLNRPSSVSLYPESGKEL